MLFARYQSRLLVWLVSLSLLVAFVGAMTVQFIGGARLLETAAGIPYDTGLLIFGVSIALYTAYGGFRASVLNDTMQGMVMLIGTIVLLVGVIHAAGGWPCGRDAAVDRRQAGVPAGRGGYPLANLYGLVLGAGLLRRYWSATYRSALYLLQRQQSQHRGIIIGTIVVAILMFGMHLAGALGRAVIPDLTVPDLVIPTLMVKVLPPFAAGIFLAAPMAAIMSTINAQLLQSSATIIKDLYLNWRPDQATNEKRLKRMSAGITLLLGVLLLLAAAAAGDDNLAEPAGLRRPGSRLPVAAGAGPLLGTRQRGWRAERDDRRRRPVCRTGHAESAVSGLSPDRSRAAAEFAGVCDGEQFRSSRPTVPHFDY